MARGDTIETITAFTFVDETGVEGICGFRYGNEWRPMVAADADRIRSLWPVAADIANATGRPVKLVQFGTRTELEKILPR